MGKAFPVASPSVLPLPLLVSLNPAQIFPSGSFIQLSLAIPIPGPCLLCPVGILTFTVISQNHRNRVSSGSDLPWQMRQRIPWSPQCVASRDCWWCLLAQERWAEAWPQCPEDPMSHWPFPWGASYEERRRWYFEGATGWFSFILILKGLEPALACGKEPLDREGLEVREWETWVDPCPGLHWERTGRTNLDHITRTS